MRVISLGSGSSGNALLIEAGPKGRTKILVDAGFNGRTLIERLRIAGTSPAQLQGILLTHEHTDHILGLPTLVKRYGVPVIADPLTIEAVERIFASGYITIDADQSTSIATLARDEQPSTGQLQELPIAYMIANDNRESLSDNHTNGRLDVVQNGSDRPIISQSSQPFAVGSRTMIGDIEVISFPVSHDAVAPCGYLLSAGGCRVCVAIDSGEVTATMLEAMSQADLLVIESNHDREKLLRGPYPYSLKQRILSPTGHLSNDQAADAVLRTWRGDGVRWLWLSHLSRTNNTPKLALNNMHTRLTAAKANLAQVHISVLPPGMGGVWDSTQLWSMASLWEMGE
ncbi:MAG TPA: MBL fold metallo-hydrolase [Ktedonobacteraceae bacterium]|nr:MBL fold metallo-hydrolase [Ktedonobacteraceae bacterium]